MDQVWIFVEKCRSFVAQRIALGYPEPPVIHE